MSATITLPELQRVASSLELAIERTASTIASAQAQRRAFRAQAQLRGAVLELGAAIALETPVATPAAADELLLVEVISPGADHVDELVRTIPANVRSMSPRTAALRLDVPYDAAGARLVGEILRRNGWRQSDFADGRWIRIDDAAALATAPGEPR